MNAKAKEPKRGRCIALGNFKGGVWKTTIAIHLAAHLKAAIIDLDVKQEDSHRFALHYGLESYLTNNEEEVFDLVERIVSSGQDVVIDCPPHEGPETQMEPAYYRRRDAGYGRSTFQARIERPVVRLRL